MSYYRLYIDSDRTEYRVKGKSPAKALLELTALAGLTLVSNNGRWGKLNDGRSAGALTEAWGRVDSPDARTNRPFRING